MKFFTIFSKNPYLNLEIHNMAILVENASKLYKGKITWNVINILKNPNIIRSVLDISPKILGYTE